MKAANPNLRKAKSLPARWKKFFLFAIFSAPACGAVAWSVFPAVRAVGAVLSFKAKHYEKVNWELPTEALQMRREVQKHFLQHKLYIPLEDIVAIGDDISIGARGVDLTSAACGTGVLYIWVPLRFNLPLLGDRVVEWCWKPKLNKVQA